MNKKYGLITLLLIIVFLGIVSGYKYFKLSLGNKDSSNINALENNNSKESVKNIKVELEELNKIKNNPYMILVNKDNKLSGDHIPENLVKSNIEFQSHIETRQLDKKVSDSAKEMFEAAKEEGITLLGASGYRAYTIQKNMFDKRVKEIGETKAAEYLAPPGSSEHQTGFAIDILSKDHNSLNSEFEKTKAFKWLRENSYKYGFILRYPKDKEEVTKFKYEPWHYRYIENKKVAEYIMTNSISLEEYIIELDEKLNELKAKINILET